MLTLSVVIPCERIKESLPVVLTDIDSFLYSMRYKSFEVIVVGDGSKNREVVEGFENILPNIKFVKEDNLRDSIEGENILLINHREGVSYNRIKAVKKFFKEDENFVIMAPSKELNWLDRITESLIKWLKFGFKDYPLEPYLAYVDNDTLESVDIMKIEESFIKSRIENISSEILEVESKRANPRSYLKFWYLLIKGKLGFVWKNFQNRAKTKIKRS